MATNSNNIYQKIWDADQAENGVRAILPNEPRDEDRGYVVVDEETSGRNKDHQLLPQVNIPEPKMATYDLCTKLFNNYTLNNFSRESNATVEEEKEVDTFINAIKDTGSMKLAHQFYEEQEGRKISDTDWVSLVKKVWFLQYSLGDAPSRNGFEHVFVGEQKGGKIGGYHFWYKYFLDDQAGLVGYADGEDNIDYNGTEYRGRVTNAQGITNPDVATFSYKWDAYDYEKQTKVTGLSKPIGGFWIGCSPEGLMALGMVRFHPNSPRKTEINSNQYDLKLFKDNASKSINTFYPVLIGVTLRPSPPDVTPNPPPPVTPNPPPPVTPIPPPPVTPNPPLPVTPIPGTNKNVRIVAALVNPEGDDTGKETITLVNIGSTEVDLAGWSIAGNNKRGFTIVSNSKLDGGEFRTYRLPRDTAQLRNKRNSKITLRDQKGSLVQEVTYVETTSGQTILFNQD